MTCDYNKGKSHVSVTLHLSYWSRCQSFPSLKSVIILAGWRCMQGDWLWDKASRDKAPNEEIKGLRLREFEKGPQCSEFRLMVLLEIGFTEAYGGGGGLLETMVTCLCLQERRHVCLKSESDRELSELLETRTNQEGEGKKEMWLDVDKEKVESMSHIWEFQQIS